VAALFALVDYSARGASAEVEASLERSEGQNRGNEGAGDKRERMQGKEKSRVNETTLVRLLAVHILTVCSLCEGRRVRGRTGEWEVGAVGARGKGMRWWCGGTYMQGSGR
jgi:hypothetical protein